MTNCNQILLATFVCFLRLTGLVYSETTRAPTLEPDTMVPTDGSFNTTTMEIFEVNTTQPSSGEGYTDSGKNASSNNTQSDTTFPTNATQSYTTTQIHVNTTFEPPTTNANSTATSEITNMTTVIANDTYTSAPGYENTTTPMRTENVTMATDVFMSTLPPEPTDSTNVTTENSTITTTPSLNITTSPVFVSPNVTSPINSTAPSNTTDVYYTTPDVSGQPNTNETNITSTVLPTTQIITTVNATVNLTTVMPNMTTEYPTSTLRTTSSNNFTTISSNTSTTTRPTTTWPNDTNGTTTSKFTTAMTPDTNTTDMSSTQSTSPQITTKSTSAAGAIQVTLVLFIFDDDHKPVIGPVVQMSSRSFDTIRIQNSSSYILRKTVFVKKGDDVVVIVMKPGFATNSVRWVHSDETNLIIPLAKLQPAVVKIDQDTVHIETTTNEDGHDASIQFRETTSDWSNLSATCLLLTNDLWLLPDPTSNTNNAHSDVVSLIPYAAIQLTLQNGDIPVTMVTGGFAMVIPINDDEVEFENGETIPAWYFDEHSGTWLKGGEGTVQKTPSDDVMYWHFSAPHLSWWMAATEVKIAAFCPAGTSSTSGLSDTPCQPCAVDKYQPSSRSTSCIDCDKGTGTPGVGSTSSAACLAFCPAGTSSTSGLSDTPCQPCAVDKYQPSSRSTSCIDCDKGTGTPGVGSTSSAACLETSMLGSLTGMQFIIILIIACMGVFGIGSMIIFVCIKPKEVKGIKQNGSSRSRKENGSSRSRNENGSSRSSHDSDTGMAEGTSTTNLATNIELKENPDQDMDLPPPPPPIIEPPTVSIGMVNHGMDSDIMDGEITPPPEHDFKFDETSSYVYPTHLDVSDSNDKIDDSSSFVYTNNTFLNVGGQKDRTDTGSILDMFVGNDDDSQSASHNSGPSEDGSSISYKENIVV